MVVERSKSHFSSLLSFFGQNVQLLAHGLREQMHSPQSHSPTSNNHIESLLPLQAAQCPASHFRLFLGRKKELSAPAFTSAFLSVPGGRTGLLSQTKKLAAQGKSLQPLTHGPCGTKGRGTPHPSGQRTRKQPSPS